MLLITIAALTVSVGFLALRANRRKGYNLNPALQKMKKIAFYIKVLCKKQKESSFTDSVK